MKTIVIIPARGGSKGIPRKNIIDFCGEPLIGWSIIQALSTPEIDAVYVSSDSQEILEIAVQYGANVIERPSIISGDFATSESAIVHAIEQIQESIGTVIMLQPTSPLRKPLDLSQALRLFTEEKLDSLFSGAVLEDFLIWNKNPDGDYSSFNYNFLNRGRRQDRLPQYVENGSFYIFKPEIIINNSNRLGGKIGFYQMEHWQTFEIDSFDDLELIKLIFDIKIKSHYGYQLDNISRRNINYV